MSIFKDDISLSNSIQGIQTNVFQVKNIKENPTQEINSLKSEEFEKVVLSDKIQRKQKYNETLENMQEEINLAQTAKQGLSSIQNQLKEMKNKIEETIKESTTEENIEEVNNIVKEGLGEIQNIVENTSFNEVKPLKESSFDDKENNIDKEKHIKKAEDIETFLKKIDNQTREMLETQKQITKYEEKIIQKVDSLVELSSNLDANKSIQEKVEIGKELKETAINGIIKDPETGRKIQIKALDDNLLLALFSVFKTK